MLPWYEIDEIHDDLIKFVILIAQYNDQFIVIRNKKRGGWEIPGGNRELGETLLFAATRELYEETGAIQFDLEPFGITTLNGNHGMVFFAEVHHMTDLPDYEIEEIKFVDHLPEGLNFGEMFNTAFTKWNEYSQKNTNRHSIDVENLFNDEGMRRYV